jgi:hypothetical protein
MLFNFRMDVDAAPVQSIAALTPLAPGAASVFQVTTLPEPRGWPALGAGIALLARLRRTRRPSAR